METYIKIYNDNDLEDAKFLLRSLQEEIMWYEHNKYKEILKDKETYTNIIKNRHQPKLDKWGQTMTGYDLSLNRKKS